MMAMDLRLKKLAKNEAKAEARIELTQRQLEEVQRIKKEKARETEQMTEHVRNLIKLENEYRQTNTQIRTSLKAGLN